MASSDREPWLLYLVDRADGVRGHYAIARWNPAGYREVWNLRSHEWAAFSDEVLTREQADELLRQVVIPTARASAPVQEGREPVELRALIEQYANAKVDLAQNPTHESAKAVYAIAAGNLRDALAAQPPMAEE